MSQQKIEELKKDISILEKQLESKNVENKNLTEKCDIQNKRIKFLKKEIDEFKLKEQKYHENQVKITAEIKALKESNRKLKESVEELSRKIKDIEQGAVSTGIVTIGERVIDGNQDQLDLAVQNIDDDKVLQIVHFKRLKTLILGDNIITDIGFIQICKNLTNLTKLFLNNNKITDQHIGQIENLKQLRYLDLRMNKLTSAATRSISKLDKLTQLSLSNNTLDDEGPIELAKLQNLRYLDLTSNKITNKGAKQLMKLTSLTHLYLSSNLVTSEIIQQLIGGLKELVVADFRFNGINEEDRSRLKTKKRQEIQLFI